MVVFSGFVGEMFSCVDGGKVAFLKSRLRSLMMMGIVLFLLCALCFRVFCLILLVDLYEG